MIYVVSVLLIVVSLILLLIWRQHLWFRKMADWSYERERFFAQIYAEAQVVIAVPDHGDLKLDSSGNVTSGSVRLNYPTLWSMVEVMQQQEADRRRFTTNLRGSLLELEQWEKEHPVPSKPRPLFRRRPVPV